MPESDSIPESIHRLGSADPNAREISARAIYRAGLDLCRALIENWRADSEFGALLMSSLHAGTTTGIEAQRIIVGVAVEPANFEKIRAANGYSAPRPRAPDQDAMEFELHFGQHAELDILTTKAPGQQGAIARYLSKFGEGVQQIEIYVTDVDLASDVVKRKFKLDPIYPATRDGADGSAGELFSGHDFDRQKGSWLNWWRKRRPKRSHFPESGNAAGSIPRSVRSA